MFFERVNRSHGGCGVVAALGFFPILCLVGNLAAPLEGLLQLVPFGLGLSGALLGYGVLIFMIGTIYAERLGVFFGPRRRYGGCLIQQERLVFWLLLRDDAPHGELRLEVPRARVARWEDPPAGVVLRREGLTLLASVADLVRPLLIPLESEDQRRLVHALLSEQLRLDELRLGRQLPAGVSALDWVDEGGLLRWEPAPTGALSERTHAPLEPAAALRLGLQLGVYSLADALTWAEAAGVQLPPEREPALSALDRLGPTLDAPNELRARLAFTAWLIDLSLQSGGAASRALSLLEHELGEALDALLGGTPALTRAELEQLSSAYARWCSAGEPERLQALRGALAPCEDTLASAPRPAALAGP